MINRNLINPDIEFYNGWSNKAYPINYDEFCNYIDLWKAILVNELDFKPRSVVAFGSVTHNIKILALHFAIWELGGSICRFPIMWFPNHANAHVWTKVRPDLFIWDAQMIDVHQTAPVLKQVAGRSWTKLNDVIQNDDVKHLPLNETTLDILSYKKPQSRQDPAVSEHDICWIDYDPETGNAIEFTHDHVYGLVRRNASILGLKNTVGISTHNTNHECMAINYTLPACFACKSLNTILIPDYKAHFPPNAPIKQWFRQAFDPEGDKVVFIRSLDILEMFLDANNYEDTHWIMLREPYTKQVHKFVKDRNIKLTIPTGDISAGSDLIFMNQVHNNEKFEEGYIGRIPDTFFQNMYNKSTGDLLIRSKYKKIWTTYPGRLEYSDGSWCLEPHEHPFNSAVENVLNHKNFEIVSYIGRLYLICFKKITASQKKDLEIFNFNDIRDQVSPRIFTEAATRYRDTAALRESLFLGWDKIYNDRVQFGGYEVQ